MADKGRIIRLLGESDFGALAEAAGSGPQLFRVLMSLAFDKEDLICWRAIEATGRAAGEMARSSSDRARTQVQRLLWMMRDESGNNVSAAPEMLGEIVANSPSAFPDIVPILASFHDEEGLRKGVMYGVLRIAESAPDLARPLSFLCREYVGDPDPAVRAYAVLLAGALGLRDCLAEVDRLSEDPAMVRLYRKGSLTEMSVGNIARETAIILRSV